MSIWKLGYPLIFIFVWVELLILGGMRTDCRKALAYIIVLGAHVQGTQVTESLARRLDCAKSYLMDNPQTMVIVTGGRGSGEDITEAAAMKEYLVASGIRDSRIIKEDRSKTTRENLLFSKSFIGDCTVPVGIVSNNFHMYRAKKYAHRVGYVEVCGIPCSCHPMLFLNYTVREFFAVIKSWIFFK